MLLKFSPFIYFLCSLVYCQDEEEPSSKNKFKEIVQSDIFVDKTLFIKLFLETKTSMYVTAPRGFGKSTNLMMLKTFLSINFKNDGSETVSKKNQNFKLFSEHRLAIYNKTSFFRQHFGEYPVLHFQFKKLILGNTSEDFIASFRRVISETFDEHVYLLDSSVLEKLEKEQFDRLRTRSEEEHPSSLAYSGKTLTSFLYTHFNRSCVVLIDDFDFLLPQIMK